MTCLVIYHPSCHSGDAACSLSLGTMTPSHLRPQLLPPNTIKPRYDRNKSWQSQSDSNTMCQLAADETSMFFLKNDDTYDIYNNTLHKRFGMCCWWVGRCDVLYTVKNKKSKNFSVLPELCSNMRKRRQIQNSTSNNVFVSNVHSTRNYYLGNLPKKRLWN